MRRPSLRPAALTLLTAAVVYGLLSAWAVSAAHASVSPRRALGLAGAGVVLVAAVTLAAHAVAAGRRLRKQNAALSVRADRLTAELQRVTEESRRATDKARRAAADAKRSAEQAAQAETRRAAALTASANAAGRMQALATSMLADLREMENRHTDEDVLADLLHLDHHIAQTGRLADSVAVLTGARSGRRWARPIVMESILRGAMGRISGYQRVRVHSTCDLAIAGHAAEGVMHALAELLDNAANFSPPTAEVHVYVEEVPAGVVITVEDSGLVMNDVQLRRAEQAVVAEDSDLTSISGTRLGLAVVGRLARKHGLTVSFRPSARGGTGALLRLPQELIARARSTGSAPAPVRAGRRAAAVSGAPSRPRSQARRTLPAVAAERPSSHEAVTRTPASAPLPAAVPMPASPSRAAAPDASEAPADTPVEIGESGLPKRRRGRTLAASLLRTGDSEHRGAAKGEGRRAGSSGTRTGESEHPSASEDETRPAGSSGTQATRFGTFRKAVRASGQQPQPSTDPQNSEGTTR